MLALVNRRIQKKSKEAVKPISFFEYSTQKKGWQLQSFCKNRWKVANIILTLFSLGVGVVILYRLNVYLQGPQDFFAKHSWNYPGAIGIVVDCNSRFIRLKYKYWNLAWYANKNQKNMCNVGQFVEIYDCKNNLYFKKFGIEGSVLHANFINKYSIKYKLQKILGVTRAKQAMFVGAAKLLGDSQARVLFAFLFSSKYLDKELYKNFLQKGVAHMAAISGFNIAVFITLFYAFVKKVKDKKTRFFITLLSGGVFWLAVQDQIPVVRAFVSFGIRLVCKFWGIPCKLSDVLFLTFVLCVVVSPGVLFSLSCHLTYGALIIIANIKNLEKLLKAFLRMFFGGVFKKIMNRNYIVAISYKKLQIFKLAREAFTIIIINFVAGVILHFHGIQPKAGVVVSLVYNMLLGSLVEIITAIGYLIFVSYLFHVNFWVVGKLATKWILLLLGVLLNFILFVLDLEFL